MKIDPSRSTVRIRTFADGLLARLAHDLELGCEVRGSVADGRADLETDIDSIRVVGVVRDGRLDETKLSPGDRRDILAKMRSDVFHGGGTVRVVATETSVRLATPRVAVEAPLRIVIDGSRAYGSFEVSLAALGSVAIKGPLNAFRVKDVVEVRFDVGFDGGGPGLASSGA